MRLLKSANSETVKHRQLSVNGERSISNNLKLPFSTMRKLCKTYSKATVPLLMSVSC
jgi:hypothetical protein